MHFVRPENTESGRHVKYHVDNLGGSDQQIDQRLPVLAAKRLYPKATSGPTLFRFLEFLEKLMNEIYDNEMSRSGTLGSVLDAEIPSEDFSLPSFATLRLRRDLPLPSAWSLLRLCNDLGRGKSMLVVQGDQITIQLEHSDDANLVAEEFSSLLENGGQENVTGR